MLDIIKGISPKGWFDLAQKLGVSGVLLFMAWHFGNRLMDNDADFRGSIVESQHESTKSVQAMEATTRSIATQERKQSDFLQLLAKQREANDAHLERADKFMQAVLSEEQKQTEILSKFLPKDKAVTPD